MIIENPLDIFWYGIIATVVTLLVLLAIIFLRKYGLGLLFIMILSLEALAIFMLSIIFALFVTIGGNKHGKPTEPAKASIHSKGSKHRRNA